VSCQNQQLKDIIFAFFAQQRKDENDKEKPGFPGF